MRYMPVIVYNEDNFKYPPFEPDFVVENTTEEMEGKLDIADLNVSQVYEWLPYTYGQTVPEGKEERREFLRGINYTDETTDEEVLKTKHGYESRCARTASRFRKELIEHYGEEKGKKIRYAEAFQLCEYGAQPDEELTNKLFYL